MPQGGSRGLSTRDDLSSMGLLCHVACGQAGGLSPAPQHLCHTGDLTLADLGVGKSKTKASTSAHAPTAV